MDDHYRSDEELVAALRAGKLDAFRSFVDYHKTRVLNICFRFVQSREDAEDVAQETFVEVARSISRLRDAADLTPWTCRIAVSKSLNLLRYRKRQKRSGTEVTSIEIDIDSTQIAASPATDPHELLELQERRRLLSEAVGSLPRNQRIAFVLSKWDGMSCEEVSGILETSVPAVEALIHRARQALQKKLTDYYRGRM
jgi:RNA polymerase sigma-70 factor, ECF subfamily